MRWGVVVAAGGLVPEPLALTLSTPRKALGRFGQRTCLSLVLDAVKQAGFEQCAVVSGPDVRSEVHHGELVGEGASAVDNVKRGLAMLGSGVEAALLLPSDAPLIEGDMLRHFTHAVESRLSQAPRAERWYAAGLCSSAEYLRAYPGAGHQQLRLKEGAYHSGALYAASPAGFHSAIEIFEQMRASRKNQLAMVMKLGPINMLRYLARSVDLASGERILGRFFRGQVVLVPDCHPATILDYDTEEEFLFCQQMYRRVRGG